LKNQYFGDINDYRKYGLLRVLLSGQELTLLVAWMLTPDDGGSDGGFRAYLEQPDQWHHFDSELYAGLRAALRSTRPRSVALIEDSRLLPRTIFYSALVPDERNDREVWRRGLLEAATGVDLVFVDPDNGIEIPSRPIGYSGSSKYVSWLEIEGLWKAGHSLLIYQHFPRAPRSAFAAQLLGELRRRTDAPFAQGFRTAHVLFLLAAQARHEAALREVVGRDLPRWSDQVELV
jgi:hypothetical protein